MSIADLELAVETAQRNTDVSRATWASFVSLVVSGHERLADGTLRGKKLLRAKQDLKFSTDQAVAAEKDHSAAMAAELRLRRELDEARNAEGPPIAHLVCPACHKPHVDEREWRARPHRTHRCVDDEAGSGCGHEWESDGRCISLRAENPSAAPVRP